MKPHLAVLTRALATAAALLCLAAASDPSERLKDPAQEARARALFQEIRCVVCQNESIDDSDADLAGDLRRMVREEVAAGRTDAQIRTGLVDRYGEFVLLKPRFSWTNAALWTAPFLVVILGGVALLVATRRSRQVQPAELTPEEEARLARLTDNTVPPVDEITSKGRP
ncbi:cytochrome c-type biogenesis protein [Caulobacter sp. 17J65-9]|uniref:cytochrome c-type biogenesis protein n=1 Tax=Caulobacter sp. 17J65-9 TaxID=2709382 RepID=UPI0013C953D2|nr:cytochrome c-type biogenesis protein [Caulobacter sp. 17J65-9]NEX93848.1 cytochrome c-type biogenesis protein CcmH [Caulobacter sp. 17J65-9]